jgi:hypothetical protein
MERRKFIRTVAVAGAAALTVPLAFGADKPAGDLAKVRSRYLDELQKKPGADFGGYKKVRFDEIRAETDPAWVKAMNYDRRGGAKTSDEDAKKLADAGAAALGRALVQAFASKGFEVVKEAGPGVLNVKASATNLYLNAPEGKESGVQSVAEEIGKANLSFEGRDAASGDVLIKVNHRGRAKTVDRAARVSDVSNRFYFDALFAEWSKNVVAEIRQ